MAVLSELLLCETSHTLNSAVRVLALHLTQGVLMVLAIVVTLPLEIDGLAGWILSTHADSTSAEGRSRSSASPRNWLCSQPGFSRPGSCLRLLSSVRLRIMCRDKPPETGHAFSKACLKRIGIVGISLMASVSGFATISSLKAKIWRTAALGASEVYHFAHHTASIRGATRRHVCAE